MHSIKGMALAPPSLPLRGRYLAKEAQSQPATRKITCSRAALAGSKTMSAARQGGGDEPNSVALSPPMTVPACWAGQSQGHPTLIIQDVHLKAPSGMENIYT